MSTPRSLLRAVQYGIGYRRIPDSADMPDALDAYHAEMAEAEMRAAEKVRDVMCEQLARVVETRNQHYAENQKQEYWAWMARGGEDAIEMFQTIFTRARLAEIIAPKGEKR